MSHTTGESTGGVGDRVPYPNDARSVSLARRAVEEQLVRMGRDDLISTAALVVSELAGNAVLHSDGPIEVQLTPTGGGVRVSVFDTSSAMPLVPVTSVSSMTGRGLLLVRSLAAGFGFEPTPGGKVVWADLTTGEAVAGGDVESVIDAWADDSPESTVAGTGRFRVELGDVPTDLLLEAKFHVDNLVREFLLAASGERSGTTAAVPMHLAELIDVVVHRFSAPRLSIKRQALAAARRGLTHTRLELDLTPDAAEAGLEYLQALDEADAYCRAARLLTLESPPKHRVFRQWYVGELVDQLRRAEAGLPMQPTQRFEDRLLQEIDSVAAARAVAERAARLYTVAAALSGALTPEAVAEVVLDQGVV
ncbi:MAG TPA: ATP-binding protein, partial [Acidimicrobiales bacterium]|nr:ATP-binding protein [Acidimicrobiales bacterium]